MDTPNSSLIPAWIHSWAHFVKAHEKMFLIGAAALVLWHYAGVIQGYFDNKHLAQQSQTNQQIAQVEAKNQMLTEQLAMMQKNFDTTVQSLNAQIAAKKQAVIIQQKKDEVMPPIELSARWTDLISAPEGSITPQSNGTVGVSIDAAHNTVNELETIPQLTEEIKNQQTEIKQCTDLSAKKDETIAGLTESVKLEKQGRADDAKVAKDKQRKSFWKGTKFGSILTVVGIVAIKIIAH